MTIRAIATVKRYLEEDRIKFSVIDEDAVEIYMQARNLTMHLLIYQHNGHLIFRVPGFIRNVELNRLEVLQLMLKIMNEILDIRFEISPDGKSLSACCHHVIEDNDITRAQFDLLMMIIMHVVDDVYPQFLQAVYAGSVKTHDFAPVTPVAEQPVVRQEVEPIEEPEEAEEIIEDEDEKKGLKIN
ncbi:MAG: YbjN domain-containing protein [Candidatus Riflebacteria bacterium]